MRTIDFLCTLRSWEEKWQTLLNSLPKAVSELKMDLLNKNEIHEPNLSLNTV